MTVQEMPLARISPVQREAPATIHAPAPGEGPAPIRPVRNLSSRQKAAVIVRFLLAQGTDLPLANLPDDVQAELTEQMGLMRLVDRDTLNQVVREFTARLESVGLAFPDGIEGALSMMSGHISSGAANQLRRTASSSPTADPWKRLLSLSVEDLCQLLDGEAVEVAAVVMSKLPVEQAAKLLGLLPGARARRIAFAVSQTEDVDPATVRRIGHALLAQVDSRPPRAFNRAPVERVGAILNVSAAATRDEVLEGLAAEDMEFATEVRRTIFTYAHIVRRIAVEDVAKIVRIVDQESLIRAMAYSVGHEEEASTEFILANISQRMAQTLRDEMAERGTVKQKDAEAAMNAVVTAIRQLEGMGELEMRDLADESVVSAG